ncbi:structural maintenance of chromosome 4 [Nematocida sp. AWRm80]|nr:structural maintenance of chromosome 4 [Nematocida sp. AWRm80]
MNKENKLFIESIFVNNFKSYKGEHTIGPFEKGFNSIVGPNGSGKSNVIDSVLFVLGFKAKKLRHSRAEDLIHSGEPKPTKTTVCITFVTQDDKKIAISRTVTNKGKSTYAINGAPTTLDQVSEILKEYNVDLVNNRFMILQGEIESISNMKPKGTPENPGLVEYLEEIIGTNQYIDKIKEKAEELQKVSEMTDKFRIEHRFVEKELEYLRPKAEQAQTSIAAYAESLFRKLAAAESDLKTATCQLASTKEQALSLEESLKEARTKLHSHQEEKSKLDALLDNKKTIQRKEEAAYLKCKQAYEKTDLEYRKSKELLEIYQAKSKTLKEEIDQIKQARAQQKLVQEESAKEIQSNTIMIDQAKTEKQKIDSQIEHIDKTVLQSLKASLDTATDTLLKQMQAVKREKDCYRKESKEYEEYQRTIQQLNQTIDTVPKEIEKIKEQSTQYNEEKHKKIENKLSELRQGYKETLAEHSKRQTVLEDIQKEMDQGDISDRLNILSSIKGYVGRVRALGTIPDKYLIALSATAKGSLNNLVVDTTKTAEKCLDVIKANNLGRHTIIVLDKIKQTIGTSKDSNRLVDKIKCNPEHAICFYHLIGDTLVVNNMDAAMKRAFAPDRPKVVTLDGKVIDRSGLMSGGTVRIIKLSQKRPAGELTKELQHAKAQLKEATEGMHTLEQLIEKTESKLEIYKEQLRHRQNAKKTIEALTRQLDQAQKDLQAHKQQSTAQNKLKQCLDKKQKQIDQMISTQTKLEEEKHKIEQAIASKAGSEYTSWIATRTGLEKQIFILQERNHALQAILTERIPSEKDKEEELKTIKQKIAQIVLVPPKTEEEHLLKAEAKLEEAKIETDQTEEQHSQAKSILNTLLAAESSLNDSYTEAISNTEKYQERIKEQTKRVEILKDQSLILNTKLGKYAGTLSTTDNKEIDPNLIDSLIDVFLTYQYKKECLDKETAVLLEKESEETVIQKELASLKEERASRFLSSIKQINKDLKGIYNMLTFGGDAEIEPVDYLDPFTDGMIMSVMPPRKSWKSISHLSGGERTLASLSLIFALHEYYPNSFYVMDEIDAALDYKNVGIVGRFIAEKSKECQFLVISLRENMYELSNMFIGVYRPAETTLSIAIKTTPPTMT